jgi:hypothetical protein
LAATLITYLGSESALLISQLLVDIVVRLLLLIRYGL